jgi:hypothetical protein
LALASIFASVVHFPFNQLYGYAMTDNETHALFEGNDLKAQHAAMCAWRDAVGYSTLSDRDKARMIREYTGLNTASLKALSMRLTTYRKAHNLPRAVFRTPGACYGVQADIDVQRPELPTETYTADYKGLSRREQIAIFLEWKKSVCYSSLATTQKRRLLSLHLGMPVIPARLFVGDLYSYAQAHNMAWPCFFTPVPSAARSDAVKTLLPLLLAQPHHVYATATPEHQLATLNAWVDTLPTDYTVTAQDIATHMGLSLDAAKGRYMQLQSIAG